MKNTTPRGSYVENVTSIDGTEITTVSWKDNKQVILASTYVGAEPVEKIERYDKKEKKKVHIPCPKLVKEYNSHMGGVDLMDSFLGRYKIRVKSRKWYIRIFYHLLDLTVINSWILYKKVMVAKGKRAKDIMNLADFRSELADTLCKLDTTTCTRGRPSNSSTCDGPPPKMRKGKPCQNLPSMDIRFDGVGHAQTKMDKRMRCMLPNCNLKTVTMCKKCKIHLCSKKTADCFNIFHQK